MRVTVTVDKCASCPYFTRSVLSVIARGPNAGDCHCPTRTKAGEVTLARSLPVENNAILPTWCPLRLGDVVVTIGNRGSA